MIMRYTTTCLLLAVCLLNALCYGEESLLPAPTFPFGFNAQSLVTGDFNGDGTIDFATKRGNGGGDVISIVLGRNDGTFYDSVEFHDEETLNFRIATGDFNNDGVSDLVVVNRVSDNLSVLIAVGDGTFHPEVNYSISNGPKDVVIADLNDDGFDDLVSFNCLSENVTVLLSNESGTFSSLGNFFVGNMEQDKGNTGDFNGDGIVDLAILIDQRLHIWTGNGDGTFTGQGMVTNSPDFPGDTISFDANGDQISDIAFLDGESMIFFFDSLSIMLGNGDNTFSEPTNHDLGSFPLTFLDTGDFNADGVPDLATTNTFLFGIGDGTFQPQEMFLPQNSGSVFTLGSGVSIGDFRDFNRDGFDDLATYRQEEVTIYLNNRDDSLVGSRQWFTGDAPLAVVAADFDGDGDSDFATANSNGNDITVRLGIGNGNFFGQLTADVGTFPSALIAEDLNLDGHTDIATANSNSNNVSVLLGNGDGSFEPQAVFPVGDSPNSIAAADLNGDGILDLVAANGGSGDVSVLIGNGNGTFLAQTSHLVSGLPVAIAVADLDNDSFMDLIVGTNGSANLSILFGQGNGDFSLPELHNAGNQLRKIVAEDLNNDGITDLAVGDTSQLTVRLGVGDGTFLDEVNLPLPMSGMPSPFPVLGLTVADFNADGSMDLAAVTFKDFDSDLWLFLGLGDGTFGNRRRFSADLSNSMAAGDFNGDNLPDLVLGAEPQDRIFFHANITNCNLLGDINGDGIVSLLDVGPFVELIANTQFQLEADINRDGIVDLLDIGPFVELLSSL